MTVYALEMRKGRCHKINGTVLRLRKWQAVRPKYGLYVIRRDSQILYVGETSRGVWRCLHGLFSAHGTDLYQWRNDPDVRNADIEMMFLGLKVPQYQRIRSDYREVIESEIAFNFRTRDGRWPSKLRGLRVNAHIARKPALLRGINSAWTSVTSAGW